MFPLDVLGEPVWQRLTWTLLHFLWEGLAVAAAVVMVLYVWPVRRAHNRYLIYLSALIAMAACPLVTFMVIKVPESLAIETTESAAVVQRETNAEPPLPFVPGPGPGFVATETPVGPTEPATGEAQLPLECSVAVMSDVEDSANLPVPATWEARLRQYVDAIQPYALSVWIAGVLLLAVRLSLSWLHVRWLAWGCRAIPADLATRAMGLGRRLGLRFPPRVCVSEKISEAIVVGLWRPLVLLPVSWLTEMTPEVLEAVIAHELAHVRRLDLWVNLLQRLMETLLFYHPAVWWLSRRVGLEREMCADELAVGATNKRLVYATALEQLGRMRLGQTAPQFGVGMGGNKMVLLNRVGNILGLSASTKRARWWPVGLLALAVPLAIWLASTSIVRPELGEARAEETRQFDAEPLENIAKAEVRAERAETANPDGTATAGAADFLTMFPQATRVCKVKMGPITEREMGSPLGTRCDATCRVISTLKGNVGKEVRITFRRYGNGRFMPSTDVPTKAGEVYVVMLQGETAPYTMFSAMKAIEAVVEPKFGPKLDDRMMAELVAMWKSDDKGLRIRAIKQIGIMRDTRGSEQVNAAAKSEDAQTARAGVIAQYRMKIAPDAKRTMELFDQWMMVVWCRESGDPQRDANGNRILRRERGRDFIERPFMVRGLPDFDYATYVREGIKKDWVRKDDHLLDAFFSVPWKVQRKACIPELVELLDDPNKRVRWGAVLCLTHTVDHADRPRWEQFERHESEELGAWRKWWKEEGDAYMARHATPPAAASPPEQPAANPIEHRVEPAGDPRSGAKIELVADKQEYFLGENVLLHYGVTNQGKQPFVVSFGGDSRSFPPRALRFKVVAIDENGRPIDDPYPAVMSFGGPGGDTTLEPGKAFWNSFPLMLYCDFLRPGVYKIRVYHDLGWEKSDGADKQHDNVTTNALPKGPHHAPIVETTVKLTLPDPQQARRVVAEMLSLPTDAGSWGERAPPRQDVTVLRHPVYLPIVEKLAQQGSQPATTAVGSIPTPEATRALIRLLDCPDRDVAAKSLELLLRRLPISDLDYRAFGANQRRLARRAWRDEMQPAVVEVGWRLMAKKDRASLIKAAQIIECLGRPSDFPRFIKELDRVLGEMKDDPTEQNAFPRPANASGSMIRAGWQLIERGAAVPTDPQTPGQAALFMLALGRRADFRPADWQATAGELLRHPIPYVRSVTLENLRNVPLGPLGEAVIPLLSDEHLAVSVAACALAAATKSKQYRKPLLEVLRAADDQWLMQEAHRAAIACGADRDRVLEICIDQLGRPRPADSSLYPWILALMIEVVEQEGGTGHSHTDWSAAGELAARWRELLEANREQIRAGKRFKIAEPPLTPDLFPRGFQFQRKDNPPWPDWSSRAAATPKEPGREEDERNGENNAGGEAAVEDEESEARRVDGNLRPDPFSELDLRRAMAVAEVAQLEYVTAMEANEKVPGTVPKVELKRLETAQRLAELDVERARLSGSDDDATENTDTLQPDTEEKKDPAKRIAAPSRTTVRGKVVDDVTGKPVANFITQAGKFDPADPAKVVWGYSETRGGWKSSTFSATVRWPEGWTARIVAPGYLPQPILAEPPSPGQDAIDVVIRLKRGDTIRGRVLDHTGQGVAKAGVYLAGRGVIVLAEGPWDELQGSSVHTDAEGRFEISGRGEDSKAIFVTAPTLYVWRADLPEPGQEVTIRLPEPAKLHIRYDIEGGPPAARVRIELRTWDMPKWNALVDVVRWVEVKAGEDGLVVNNLPPGVYDISRIKHTSAGNSGKDMMLDRQLELTLASGKTTAYNFVRETGTPISGDVAGLPKEGVSGVFVSVRDQRVSGDPRARDEWKLRTFDGLSLQGNGSFQTERIPPGKYQVVVEAYKQETPEEMSLSGWRLPKWMGTADVDVPESGEPPKVRLMMRPYEAH